MKLSHGETPTPLSRWGEGHGFTVPWPGAIRGPVSRGEDPGACRVRVHGQQGASPAGPCPPAWLVSWAKFLESSRPRGSCAGLWVCSARGLRGCAGSSCYPHALPKAGPASQPGHTRQLQPGGLVWAERQGLTLRSLGPGCETWEERPTQGGRAEGAADSIPFG